MAEHTKLSWEISKVRTTDGTFMVVGGDGQQFGLIADVTNEADAAYIVKACNAFPDLVKALEDVVKNNQITVWRTIKVDTAGNTMESTEVDGPLAVIARRALAPVKSPGGPDA